MVLRWIHLPVFLLVLSLCLSPTGFHLLSECTHCEHAFSGEKVFFADAGTDGTCLCGCHLKTDFSVISGFGCEEPCAWERVILMVFSRAGFHSFFPPPPRP